MTLGLVPRQRSTGGKARLGAVSKMGQTDIRRLLIVGAMSVIRWVVRKGGSPNRWLAALVARKPKMVAAVALANSERRSATAPSAPRTARMIWAMTTTLLGLERLKRVPLIGTEATADFHQGAQPSCCNPDAVYMAAAEITPASPEKLLPHGSHPYTVRGIASDGATGSSPLATARAEHDVLACMAFDETLHSKLHSTNPLERAGKEIKRRTNVVGIFPNREAVIVPRAYAAPPGPRSPVTVGALMPERNDEWAFRGLRRATGATVPSTPPRHAGGNADARVQRSRGGDNDRRTVNERRQP